MLEKICDFLSGNTWLTMLTVVNITILFVYNITEHGLEGLAIAVGCVVFGFVVGLAIAKHQNKKD